MRSTKSIILIVIALGCGLIASIGISQVMNQDGGEAGPKMETIYVAAGDVPSWSKLNSTLVKEEEWPVDKIPEGAARSLDEFDGLSPRYPLYPGEPIVKSKLSDGMGTIASERIPEGHQVFAVKVDKESALAGLLNPGDKVDVLVFIRGRSGTAEQVSTGTRTILRNVTVFAVNDQIARSSDDESSIDAKTVSLLVRPKQSERLLLAKQLGTIHLALRKPGDDSQISTDGARPGDLNGTESGSDGQLAGNSESKPSGGIFDILNGMKGEDSKAVDSSNATEIPPSTMVIMSPEGVLGTYTFAGENKQGGLPELPTELLGAYDQPEDGLDSAPSELPETDVDGTSDDDGPTDDDAGLDDVVDPSVLGL